METVTWRSQGDEEMSIMCMKIKRMGIYNTCVLSIYMSIIAVCMFVCVHMVLLTGSLVKRVWSRIRATGQKRRGPLDSKFELLLKITTKNPQNIIYTICAA